jgi:paraquat-inducible protein B
MRNASAPPPPEGPDPHDAAQLPAATVRKRKWTISVVWVVPLAAAVVAAYLLFGRLQEYGTLITIRFKDASGIIVGQTDVEYRGVPVGRVKELRLSPDLQSVLVKVRLLRSAAPVARDGSLFWVVRLRNGNLTNFGAAVGTVFKGSYLQVLPGTGPPRTEFSGLDQPPAVQERGALHIVLHTGNADSIGPGTPLFYRGVEVGVVQDFKLNSAGTRVDINAVVRPQYVRLVRSDSHFWVVSGVNAHFGLFKGLQIDVPPLRTLISGGIAFSTPEGAGAKPARNGMEFQLHAGPAAAHPVVRSRLFGSNHQA